MDLTNAQLVLATHNSGKVLEIQDLLKDFGVSVLSAGDLGLPEPIEDGATFEANAIIKSRAAADASNKIALADDSGLAVDGLDGAPGIYSARWAGPDKDFKVAMDKVHKELGALGDNPNRKARFVCVLALSTPSTDTQQGVDITFRGEVTGTIVPPAGNKGFGYDPIFQPDGYTITFAQMESRLKQSISHRANAFAKFVQACFS